jgi:hypothetical protein
MHEEQDYTQSLADRLQDLLGASIFEKLSHRTDAPPTLATYNKDPSAALDRELLVCLPFNEQRGFDNVPS